MKRTRSILSIGLALIGACTSPETTRRVIDSTSIASATAALTPAARETPTPVEAAVVRTPVLLGVVDTVIAINAGSPFGAAASSRGLAYVTLHGGVSALASWDFTTRAFVNPAVATGVEPTNVVFAPNGKVAYVASQWSSAVDQIDVGNGRASAQWPTPGNDPFQVAVSADGDRAFVGGNASSLFIFDTRSGKLRGQVAVGRAPNGLAVSSDRRRVYLTHLGSSEIGLVDPEAGTYRIFAQMDGAQGQGILLAKDERTLFAVSQAASRLYAFDAESGQLIASVATAEAPFGLAITPDGVQLWVTTLSGTFQRFSSEGLRELGRLELGGRLRRLAIDPHGRGAVIADEDGRILVIR